MMVTSVSIIIPVFNAEETIGETLESIQAEIENSPSISWEVIAIDDGSSDNSIRILGDWKSKLSLKIKEIKHTGSPAKPRNIGIELAKSKYVFFLDADDKLITGGLTAAVELAEQHDSDVVLPRLVSLDGRGVPRGMFSKTLTDVTLSNSRIYWALNPMKLIKRSLLENTDIRFDSTLRRDEDQPFAFKAFLAAKRISILADPPVVGVRYSPSGNNLTLRDYSPDDLFQYLAKMTKIMDVNSLDNETRHFLLIRNWEIEISREFIWKRLALLPESIWQSSLEKLSLFSEQNLVAKMLPKTSIRWRGIVGLIATKSNRDLEILLKARRRVLQPKNILDKARGILFSNLIRLKATIMLPNDF